jgi:hypothetical protein
MKTVAGNRVRRGLRFLVAALCLLFASALLAQTPNRSAMTDLRARYASLQNELEQNQFGRPLHLDSVQKTADLSGDIYAVVNHSFVNVNAALDEAEQWCDVLILHLNVKQCRSAGAPPVSNLVVYIGTKHTQPLAAAQRVDFDFRVQADSAQYLQILLRADTGPLGMRNFRIMLEAVPLDGDRSFIHLSYSYSYGLIARMAMKTYLGTIGRDKVGFSVVGRSAEGQPVYVGDMRGVIERNTMRYYLAIDAYLATYHLQGPEQLERRLRGWFAATERYPLQLHELGEREYLEMKRTEISQQQPAGTRSKAD